VYSAERKRVREKMILTDKFVYIHQPKTGGTFVTGVLARLYGLERVPVGGPEFRVESCHPRYGSICRCHKHGQCRDIPVSHQQKPIVATVRNPYDRYVSEYEFGWWRSPRGSEWFRYIPGFEVSYPHFPNLTFAEYVGLMNSATRLYGLQVGEADPGWLSIQFVYYYFRELHLAIQQLSDAYISSQKYKEDMYNVCFLRTDRLNQELYDFLLRTGYERTDLGFILHLGKILPDGKGRREDQAWEKYYTPQLKRWVRRKEWVLFSIFPEFDV
jgi:Sulfotransferase family